jgi:hypothetical protein
MDPPLSVDICLIPALGAKIPHKSLGGVRPHFSPFGADLDERGIDVHRHALGIAADLASPQT